MIPCLEFLKNFLVYEMRKFSLLIIFFIQIAFSPFVFAGSVENKSNWSAEYVRTLNRNAATEAADAAVYNPAGVVNLEDGLYGAISMQNVRKDYSNTVADTEYESNTPSIVPGLFGVYKQGRWAAFAGVTVPIGGGRVEYDQGSVTTLAVADAMIAALPTAAGYSLADQSLEADSFAIGYTLGGAYRIHPRISVSLAARYIDSKKNADGSVTVGSAFGPAVAPDLSAEMEYQQQASGWGAVIGADFFPTENLTVAGRYETATRLEYEVDVKEDNLDILASMGITDGSKSRRDLPALLGVGIAYRLSSGLRIETNCTYYFQEAADWDGAEKEVNNGFEAGIALEYAMTPKITASVGYLYTDTGIDADAMLPEAPELDAHSIGGGFLISPLPGFDMTFSIAKISYISKTTHTNVDYEKDALILAFGLQYKFL